MMPIYDKPMIYYPLSALMLAGIKNILIISTPQDLPRFEEPLGDGSELGISLSMQSSENPEMACASLYHWRRLYWGRSCALILGDNIFHGNGLARYYSGQPKKKERLSLVTRVRSRTLWCEVSLAWI